MLLSVTFNITFKIGLKFSFSHRNESHHLLFPSLAARQEYPPPKEVYVCAGSPIDRGIGVFCRLFEFVCTLRILIFTEGTILTHRSHVGLPREKVVELVKSRKGPLGVDYFSDSVPIGNSVRKIQTWKRQGTVILYLTSRRASQEVQAIRAVIAKYHFPSGRLLFRREGEEYKDVAERALPDLIVEDDCESIGGEEEMTYPHMKQDLKTRIKSIVVKEFGGIDHLPDIVSDLLNCR
jgi:hypothetical protein